MIHRAPDDQDEQGQVEGQGDRHANHPPRVARRVDERVRQAI